MKFILTVLALAMLVGVAASTLENGDLSNIDPAVFDGAQFSKEGVSAGSENLGRGASIIEEALHDKLVDIDGSQELLDEGLGVMRTDSMAGLTLDQVKTRCKRKVQKQAEAAFATKYSIFEVCLGIKAGIGKPAYDNLMADATTYKQTLATAKAAINAATTENEAIAVAFVQPA